MKKWHWSGNSIVCVLLGERGRQRDRKRVSEKDREKETERERVSQNDSPSSEWDWGMRKGMTLHCLNRSWLILSEGFLSGATFTH
jgi:hypothetical protein